jgi:indole-3-acetate monooxygenase
MPHVGIPLKNQWSRWPAGDLCRAGPGLGRAPHHSAVITGIARAGIDALIDLAGGKTPRGRTGALLCESPQVQDAVGVPTRPFRRFSDLAGRGGRSAA